MWQQFESENTKFTNWVKDVKLELREPRSEHADINLIKEDVRHFEVIRTFVLKIFTPYAYLGLSKTSYELAFSILDIYLSSLRLQRQI